MSDDVGKIQWHAPEELTLDQIAAMDGGRLGEAVKQALSRLAHDMTDRPGEKRARTLAIKLAFIPELEEDGRCEGCKMAVAIDESIPSRKSKVFDLGLRRKRGGGMMVYQSLPLLDGEELPLED